MEQIKSVFVYMNDEGISTSENTQESVPPCTFVKLPRPGIEQTMIKEILPTTWHSVTPLFGESSTRIVIEHGV